MAARGGSRLSGGGSILITIFFAILIFIAVLLFIEFVSTLPRGLGIAPLVAILFFILACLILAYIICIAIDLLSHSTRY